MTLKDIAESIGVNASTVSRALDPAKAHLVNEATIARVREAAKDLGYRGDHIAGSLRRRATATVGVIVGDLANPFIAPVIHGIAKALATEQMLPLIFETQDDADRLAWGVNHLLSRRVDAIIVAGARFGDRPVLEAATRFTPVVVAVRGLPGSPLPHVLHDDRAGGAMAARHLIELGHTRLAELRGPMDIGNFVARHEGFRDACNDAGVELVDGLGFGSRPIREEGERLATRPARPARRFAAHGGLRPQRPDGPRSAQRVSSPPPRLPTRRVACGLQQLADDRPGRPAPHLGRLPRHRGRPGRRKPCLAVDRSN